MGLSCTYPVRGCGSHANRSRKGSFLTPQMNKGGKFIFGKSLIRDNGSMLLPPMAVREYDMAAEGRVYLFTGSKSTGGFCVTRKGLLEPSKLGHILAANPQLRDYETAGGAFIPYKGRAYCWCPITPEGSLVLLPEMLSFLQLSPGTELLSIRSSDIAFTMGAKGPLLEKEKEYNGEIEMY